MRTKLHKKFILTIISLIIFIGSFGLAENSFAATYYVRTDGNNSNIGMTNTPDGAWRTIDYAADHISAGDIVKVQSGNYVERVSPGVSGTGVDSTVTLVADGAVTVCGFDMTSKNYIRIIGFTMDTDYSGCPNSAASVLIIGTNSYLEFWNNIMRDAVYNGIRNASSPVGIFNNSIIIGNTFHNLGIGNGSGVAVSIRGDNNLISYNEIYNIHPDAFYMFGSNNRVTNNYIHDLSEASGGHSDVFQTGSSIYGWNHYLIEANLQIGMGNTGHEHTAQISNGQATSYCPGGCGAMTENIFRRNVWHNVSSGTIGINQTFDGAVSFTRYYSNTSVEVQKNYPTARYGLTWYGPGTSDGYVYNNIEYKSWGSDPLYSIMVYYVTGGLIADYNLAYDPDGDVSFASPWTAQSNSQSNVNPQFINYAGDDFHLQSNSGATNNAGPLTTTSGSDTGTTFSVTANGGGFFRGDNTNLSQYGGNLVIGDVITVGDDVLTISNISGDSITVTSPFTWADGDPVYFGNDSTPDIGAYPYKSSYALSGTWNKSGDTVTVTPNDPSLVRFVVVYEDGIPKGVANSSPYSISGIGNGTVTVKIYTLYASATPMIDATFNGVTPPPPPPKQGDLNNDNIVDINDYNILVGNFGRTGSGIVGDIDSNGAVNIFDYNLLVGNFGR